MKIHSGNAMVRFGVFVCFVTALLGIVAAYPDSFGRPSYQAGAFRFFDEAVFTVQFPLIVVILLAVRSVHAAPNRSWGRLGATGFSCAVLGCSLIVVKEVLIFLNATAGLPLTQAVVTVLMAAGSVLTLVGLPLVATAVLRARTIPVAELAILLCTVIAAATASAVLGRAAATVTGCALWCWLAIILWRQIRGLSRARAPQDMKALT
jgi:hypothetical protein